MKTPPPSEPGNPTKTALKNEQAIINLYTFGSLTSFSLHNFLQTRIWH